jgi:hypothetical protein
MYCLVIVMMIQIKVHKHDCKYTTMILEVAKIQIRPSATLASLSLTRKVR